MNRIAFVPFLSWALSSCTGAPPRFDLLEVAANDNPAAPLAAILTARTNVPTRLEVRVIDGTRERTLTPSDLLATEHRVPVLGLRAGGTHEITAAAVDAAGNRSSAETRTLQAASLPPEFPRIETIVSSPERMEPGVTLFNLMRWPESGADDKFGALVAVDETGAVVWYYVAGETVEDARQLANGNILYSAGRRNAVVREIDALGSVVRSWFAGRSPHESGEEGIRVDTDSFHHEIGELPSGNFMTLSTEVRTFENYPASDTDQSTKSTSVHVVGDVVVEFSPSTGEVLRRVKLVDVLDPRRIGFDSLGGRYWENIYPKETEEGLNDWAHANGAFYDARDDSFVVSMRHQDAVVKVRGNGELVWILGNHASYPPRLQSKLLSPRGELEWPYHTHSPEITPHGTLLLFDNGTHRASPFTGETKMPLAESYSRAVEYAIDEEKMEVREVWRHGGAGENDERFFSTFISDVDWLPQSGNVLVTDGGRIEDADGTPVARPGVHRWARIVEVTHDSPPAKVFEIEIRGDPPEGWHVYRAERIPSLYGEPAASAERAIHPQ